MKNLRYILLAGFVATAFAAGAQSNFSVQYSIGVPTGNLKQFNTTTSFRGITMEYRKMVQPNMGVGFDVGWNVFYERHAKDTYTQGTISLSGVQYRYTNSVPLLASFNYYMKPGEKLNPFVGLGIGTLYSYQAADMGLYRLYQEDWQFALKPEVGVRLSTGSDTDVYLGLKYYAGFGTSDMDGQSYLAFNLGFTFGRN